MPSLTVFSEWRDTQRAALAAEIAMYRAELEHCAGRAAAADPELVRSAELLQAQARSLFMPAMREMQLAARSLQFPPTRRRR